jgi:hypothetical protein
VEKRERRRESKGMFSKLFHKSMNFVKTIENSPCGMERRKMLSR